MFNGGIMKAVILITAFFTGLLIGATC